MGDHACYSHLKLYIAQLGGKIAELATLERWMETSFTAGLNCMALQRVQLSRGVDALMGHSRAAVVLQGCRPQLRRTERKRDAKYSARGEKGALILDVKLPLSAQVMD